MARKKSPPPPTTGSKSLAKIESTATISLASGGAMPGAASRRRISVIDVGPNTDEERQDLQKREWSVLESKPHQLAFRLDPHNHNADYTCLYRIKPKGIPDPILKQMAIGDSLVGTIVRARESHASAFGKPRADRLSMGYYFEWRDKREYDNMPTQERDRWRERQDRASSVLLTCGRTDGWSSSEQCSFGRWLAETTHSALTVGRIATEPVFVDRADGEPEFHSFRPVDAGTIFPTNKATARGGDAIRQRSEQLLRHLTGDQDLVVPEDEWDEYEYVQLIDGNPVQVFTDDQLLTRTMFPVPDVEYQGFPVTPCDIAVTEILTHLSIGRQNQLYFQNGRAARGMIVVTSEEVDPDMLMQMRQAFMASINGVSSAHRMPLFGLSKDDSVQWVPIDNSSRDMEFQYLNDNTSRAILSAYGMSPDELPGFAHLSRGTNSQSLSESNNEFKLEAARDVGIRPLVSFLEAVINDDIMPLIDRELAKKCRLVLWGLDAQTTDQEDAELTRAISLDGSLNDVLTKKEKQTLPRELGAGVPLNPQWHQLMQSYVPVGLIREKLLGDQGASGDPRYAYVRDPFYFQHVEAEQAKLEMLLQPPISAMAPLVLPGVLRVIFPLLSEAESKNAAAAILQQAQQMMQEQAEMAAQGEQEPQEGGEEPAQKAEPRVVIGMPQRKLLGRQRRLVDSSVRGLAAHLDKLTRELRQPS